MKMRLSKNEWMPVWCATPGQPFMKRAAEPSEAPATHAAQVERRWLRGGTHRGQVGEWIGDFGPPLGHRVYPDNLAPASRP